MNVAAPQGEYPVVDLDCRRHRDDQCCRREEETEVRVHAADVHVVRPDDETQAADRDDRPDHHAIAEDILARVRAQEVGDDAKGRQRDDINLGVAEEPEQVLEQDGLPPEYPGSTPIELIAGMKEAGAPALVEASS